VCSLRGLNLFSVAYGTTEVVPFHESGEARQSAEILRRQDDRVGIGERANARSRPSLFGIRNKNHFVPAGA
jgi:hypothetical protein